MKKTYYLREFVGDFLPAHLKAFKTKTDARLNELEIPFYSSYVGGDDPYVQYTLKGDVNQVVQHNALILDGIAQKNTPTSGKNLGKCGLSYTAASFRSYSPELTIYALGILEAVCEADPRVIHYISRSYDVVTRGGDLEADVVSLAILHKRNTSHLIAYNILADILRGLPDEFTPCMYEFTWKS